MQELSLLRLFECRHVLSWYDLLSWSSNTVNLTLLFFSDHELKANFIITVKNSTLRMDETKRWTIRFGKTGRVSKKATQVGEFS